jgi:trigger factor
MQVTAERRPGSVVELSVVIPTERVERALELAYSHLAPRVKVSGFRPGKAPRAIIERQIGWETLREHALEHLLPEVMGDAVREQKLEVIDTPQVQVETFERLQPARIKALVTVKPEVGLGDHHAVKAPLDPVAVDEAQVDQALQELRESYAELVPADNRPVRDLDHLVVDLEVLREGVPVDEQPASDLELNANQETLLPGLYPGLIGMSVGETRDTDLTLPDDYRRKELAGQAVTFRVTLKAIKERQLPELDDELAKRSGAAQTLAELRELVELRLRAAAERDTVFKQQKAALDALVQTSTLELPETLVENEIDREIRNLAINLGQQGIDFDNFVRYGGLDLAQLREERRAEATERVRQELVLDKLAEAEGLEPSPEHVDAEARRTLSGAEDAERLLRSDRVKEYVRERLRLQWALLWLAARARGETWSPPPPGQSPADEGATLAAGEILDAGLGAEERADEAAGGRAAAAIADAESLPQPVAGAPGAPSDPDRWGGKPGMVEI